MPRLDDANVADEYGPDRFMPREVDGGEDGQHVPTTGYVRFAYKDRAERLGQDPEEADAEFGRWLAVHDADVLQAAAEHAEADADSDDHNAAAMRVYRAWSLWLTQRAARIRAGAQR